MKQKAGKPPGIPFHLLENVGDTLFYDEPYTLIRRKTMASAAYQYAKGREGSEHAVKFAVLRYSQSDVDSQGSDGIKIIRVALDHKHDARAASSQRTRKVIMECEAHATRARWDRISDAFTLLGAANPDQACSMLISADPTMEASASRIRSWWLGLGQATIEDDALIRRLEAAVDQYDPVHAQ